MSSLPGPVEHRPPGDQALRTLLRLYREERRRLVLALVFFVIKHSPVWVGPLLTANIIDIIADPEHHRLAELGTQGLWLALVLVQNLPTHYLYIAHISGATRGIEMRLRQLLGEKLQRLTLLGAHHRYGTGVLQSKLLRDVEVVGQLTMNLFQNIPATVLTLLIALAATAIRAPAFLGFFLLTVPLAGVLGRQLRHTLEERNRDFRHEVEGLSGHLVEMIRLLPVTRAHGAEAAELGRLDRVLRSTYGAGLKLDRLNALFGSAAWVSFHLVHASCLLVAGWLAYRHRWSITVGDVVLLAGYFSSLTSGVLELANVVPQISKGFESLRSIGEILESTDVEDNEGKRALDAVSGHLAFEAVGYVYPEPGGPGTRALDGVSLTVRPGETLAVVGPSGAGKSTLLNLLIGFLRPTTGRILLDGQDLAEIDLRSYRRFLSVVPQETLIFDGTVADNVLHGLGDVSRERLRQALADANALEFVERLPQGVETPVGEGGARLSGGQRQRLAIARALIRDPRVLILDEATAALDSESEALVQEALGRLMRGRTTVVVAHRLSTIRHATRIAVLSAGRLVEHGTPAELLGQSGLYARLHALAQLPSA
ncbi:MAG TPA: ABC transporter ATP-binding protein [Polyangia bacterium]|nr:ABC transporter ATP-binding protein [Polyangia bacterium]